MKSLNSLSSNFVTRESISGVSNAILAFSKDEIGKSFLELAVSDLAKSYDPQSWAGNGPALILRTLRKVCSVHDLANMTDSTCNGINVLDSKQFFPIYYPSWRRYFEDSLPEETDAFTHHIWNALGSKTTVPKNSLYARLAHKYCPDVYEMFGDFFGT
ncbi:alpha 1,4-glycosyltransferase conserved region domain-containing protein [Phthorimaea operculella]|nr:alpha 1,4-glycosyltransferase conserved region domain-containing protein [Phthorimaea operculella]